MSNPSVDKFNFLFNEFLDKIINTFPNSKLKSYKRGFLVLKLTSPTTPVNLFMAGCVQYKNEIKTRHESFFIKSGEVKTAVNNFGGNFTDDCGLAFYWDKFSETTKTAIWDYMQSLFMLGEIVINKNPSEFTRFSNLYSGDYKKEISELDGDNFSIEFLSKINS